MPYDLLKPDERKSFQPHTIAEAGQMRQLRVFISHRWGQHRGLYERTTSELRASFGAFQDLSIPEGKGIFGPRGGYLEDFDIKSQMAARIFSSDLVICPSRVSMGTGAKSSTAYEIELAAVAYSVPIIFLRETNQIRHVRFLKQAKKLKLQHIVANIDEDELTPAVKKFVAKDTLLRRFPFGRRDAEAIQRSPNGDILHEVMRQYPYLAFEGVIEIFDTVEEITERRERRLSRFFRRRR